MASNNPNREGRVTGTISATGVSDEFSPRILERGDVYGGQYNLYLKTTGFTGSIIVEVWDPDLNAWFGQYVNAVQLYNFTYSGDTSNHREQMAELQNGAKVRLNVTRSAGSVNYAFVRAG